MAGKNGLVIRKKDECKWDLVSLGEVMLRLDRAMYGWRRRGSFRCGRAAASITWRAACGGVLG